MQRQKYTTWILGVSRSIRKLSGRALGRPTHFPRGSDTLLVYFLLLWLNILIRLTSAWRSEIDSFSLSWQIIHQQIGRHGAGAVSQLVTSHPQSGSKVNRKWAETIKPEGRPDSNNPVPPVRCLTCPTRLYKLFIPSWGPNIETYEPMGDISRLNQISQQLSPTGSPFLS